MGAEIKVLHSPPFLLFALHPSAELLFLWVVAIGQYRHIEERTNRASNASTFKILFRVVNWLGFLRWQGMLLWGKLGRGLMLFSVCQVCILVRVSSLSIIPLAAYSLPRREPLRATPVLWSMKVTPYRRPAAFSRYTTPMPFWNKL